MKQKLYHKLSPTQKTKTDIQVCDCVNRVVKLIPYHNAENDGSKKSEILQSSIDIYFYHVSNFLHRFSFELNTREILKNEHDIIIP